MIVLNLADPKNAMTCHIGTDGVWLTFRSSRGKTASINIEALAGQKTGIISQALYEWAMDRKSDADGTQMAGDATGGSDHTADRGSH